jgi:hypothetical protein
MNLLREKTEEPGAHTSGPEVGHCGCVVTAVTPCQHLSTLVHVYSTHCGRVARLHGLDLSRSPTGQKPPCQSFWICPVPS